MILNKIRNLFEIALICIILFIPCSVLILDKGLPDFSLPAFLKQSQVRYLSGSTQNDSIVENLSLHDFSEGKLQNAIENKLDNSVPGKFYALLGYSALQRAFIDASNELFGFKGIPPRFGTDDVFLPEQNALAERPVQFTTERLSALTQTSVQFASLASEYPDKHFCVIVTDISGTAAVQPAMSYASNTITDEEAARQLSSACHNISNTSFFASTNPNLETYYENYYTTDHHWNGWGALKAYDRAVQIMNEEQQINGEALRSSRSIEKEKGLGEIVENGSYSRSSLMLLNEPANEPALSIENMRVRSIESLSGVEPAIPRIICQNSTSELKNSLHFKFNFYETWYGGSINMILDNVQNANVGALVIGDSFSAAFTWVASEAYGTVTLFQDMRADAKQVEHLRKRINESNADYVFLVACTQNYIKTLEKFPDYYK